VSDEWGPVYSSVMTDANAVSLRNIVYSGTASEEGALRLWLERQFVEAFAQVGRIGRKRLSHVGVERRDFTLAEAAAELGVNKKGLSRFAKRLGIGHTPWKDAHSFSKADVDALRAKVSDLITLQETIPIRGIPGHEFRFLERAGFIDSHSGLIPDNKAVRYLRADVVALVERVLAKAREDGVDEGITLFSYAKQTGQKQGEVLVSLFRSQMAVGVMIDNCTGFRQLCLGQPGIDLEP
jgi:hypothetical protein